MGSNSLLPTLRGGTEWGGDGRGVGELSRAIQNVHVNGDCSVDLWGSVYEVTELRASAAADNLEVFGSSKSSKHVPFLGGEERRNTAPCCMQTAHTYSHNLDILCFRDDASM